MAGCVVTLTLWCDVQAVALPGVGVQVYRRIALGVLASQAFAGKLVEFNEQRRLSRKRGVSEGLPVLGSAMCKVTSGLKDAVDPATELVKREILLRRKVFEAQIWFLMAADLRQVFPTLQDAFKIVLANDTLGEAKMKPEYLETRPLVLDLLLNGNMATVIHEQERSAVYNMLAEANKVLEYRTVSQTNIEAVTNLVGQRRSNQAEWFLLVSVVGAVSSLSLASLVMAFKGSSGRLLVLHSPKVMEVLRVTNCLSLVTLSKAVEEVERGQDQWKFVDGFGTPATNALTQLVSANWRSMPHANPCISRVWAASLLQQSAGDWTVQEAKCRWVVVMTTLVYSHPLSAGP